MASWRGELALAGLPKLSWRGAVGLFWYRFVPVWDMQKCLIVLFCMCLEGSEKRPPLIGDNLERRISELNV